MTVSILNRSALEASVRDNLRLSGVEDVDDATNYINAVLGLQARANRRHDGIAVYENADLGHPELGQRQYVTYGSDQAQLESRDRSWGGAPSFQHGDDILPLQLPDIGGAINWRYQLVAIVPPEKLLV